MLKADKTFGIFNEKINCETNLCTCIVASLGSQNWYIKYIHKFYIQPHRFR